MSKVSVDRDAVNEAGRALWKLRDHLGPDSLDHVDATFIYRCTDLMDPRRSMSEDERSLHDELLPELAKLARQPWPPILVGQEDGALDLAASIEMATSNRFRSEPTFLKVVHPDPNVDAGLAGFHSLPWLWPQTVNWSWFRTTVADRRLTGDYVEQWFRESVASHLEWAVQNWDEPASGFTRLPIDVTHPPVVQRHQFIETANATAYDVIGVFLPAHGTPDLLPPEGVIAKSYEVALQAGNWREGIAGKQGNGEGQTIPIAIRTWWIALLMKNQQTFEQAKADVEEATEITVYQNAFYRDRKRLILRVPEAVFLTQP